jgi:phage recombination protein Bet
MSESKDLAISAEQDEFTKPQLAVLAHAGVQGAPREDLQVFFHQCKRTGLDPFNREIYMIGRRQRDYSGNWSTRYTIQVGIDGFRKIAHRKCEALKEPLSISQGYLATPAGKWVDVWTDQTRPPVAAKVVVKRGAGEFVGVAHYAEYVGLKGDGKPNHMWATKPATMLAKCAEALALRKAFPMEMSGLYTAEEMEQADNPELPERGERETKPQRAPKPAQPAKEEISEEDKQVVDKLLTVAKYAGETYYNLTEKQWHGTVLYVLKRETIPTQISVEQAEEVFNYMRGRVLEDHDADINQMMLGEDIVDAEIIEEGENE